MGCGVLLHAVGGSGDNFVLHIDVEVVEVFAIPGNADDQAFVILRISLCCFKRVAVDKINLQLGALVFHIAFEQCFEIL